MARFAYFNVLKVSSKLHAAGERAANIAVILLPPNDSLKTRVNFEFLYGIKVPFPLLTSTRALITLPNAERDLLILAPSFKVAPLAPDKVIKILSKLAIQIQPHQQIHHAQKLTNSSF